jgi:hypothetical protein
MRLISLVLIGSLSAGLSLMAQQSNLSEGLIFDGEPHFAVNPVNQEHIVIAWMGFEWGENLAINTRTSFDGGYTWSPATFIPHQAPGRTSADPIVGFNSDGQPYVCYIDYKPDGSEGAVYVVYSEDGGLSWETPVAAISVEDDPGEYPVDRPWIAMDATGGPYDGHMYLCTKPAPWEPAPNISYFIRSTDGGQSWEPWTSTGVPGWSVGPFIDEPMAAVCVNGEGTLFIVYPGWELTEYLLPRFILKKSTDGGSTFGYSQILETTEGIDDTLPKLGYSLHSDPSDPDHILLLFIAPSDEDIDIFCIETFDEGVSWTSPLRINDDPLNNGIMQDLTWAAFNENGDLVVTWRDRGVGGETGYENPSEIRARVRPAGWTFQPSFSVSSVSPHGEILNGNGNDFMCTALVEDTVLAAWGDISSGALNIWFSHSTAEGTTSLINLEPLPLEIYPNPAQAGTTITFPILAEGTFSLYDINGKLVRQGAFIRQIDTDGLTQGHYTVVVEAGEKSYRGTVVIQ